MTSTLQNSILPDLLEIPAAFRAAHYTPEDVLRLIKFDEQFGETAEFEFWLAYKSGFIPPGVWIPSDKPLCVWDRDLIHAWIDAGCPAQPNVIEHQTRVLNSLLQAVENELPARTVETNERN